MRRVGTLPWLLRNEARLTWRDWTEQTKPLTLALGVALILLVLHVALWAVVRSARGALAGPLPPEAVYAAALLMVVTFPLLLALGINASVKVLFERGDLDLLVSSPLPVRVIFASRVLSVTATLLGSALLVSVPVGSAAVMLGVPRLLGVYPVAMAMCVAAASVATFVTLLLVRLLGARRARAFSQLLAGLVGVSLVVLVNLPNVLGVRFAVVAAEFSRLLEVGALLHVDSPLLLPAKALYLDPLGVLLLLTISVGLFYLSVTWLHGSFLAGVGESMAAPPRRRREHRGALRFQRGGYLRVGLNKEWRLLMRDPYLLSQTLLHTLYLLPLLYVIIRPQGGSVGVFTEALGAAVAAGVVILTSVLAGNLMRIAVAGEEADDLLRASPQPYWVIERVKLLAALLPAAAITLIAALLLAPSRPLAAAVILIITPLANLGAARIRLWNGTRVRRQDLFKRAGRGDPVLELLEVLLPAAAAITAFGLLRWFELANAGGVIPAVAAVAALLVLGLAYLRKRTKEGTRGA